jgi:hypothetical protein
MDDTLAYNDVVRLAKRLHERVSRLHPSCRSQAISVCQEEWAACLCACFPAVSKDSSKTSLLQLRCCEQVDARKLLEAWKQLFIKAPWDPTHQVLLYQSARTWSQSLLSSPESEALAMTAKMGLG